VGPRRSALSAARFAVPDVGTTGNQGSGVAASSYATQRGYFAAVRLRDGSFRFRREREKFNGLTFFEFMKEPYQTSLTRSCCVVVITDHAKYHHARLHRQWREEHAADFVLDYLPAYSPELNPIERVWKLVRRLCLHNRCFPLLQEVMTTVEAEFVGWANPNEPSDDYAQLLKTLC